MKRYALLILILPVFTSCIYFVDDDKPAVTQTDSAAHHAKDTSQAEKDSLTVDSLQVKDTTHIDTAIKKFFSGKEVDTKNATAGEVVAFAKTLIGIPYKYASTDPRVGFDCSGFITYVFNHFGIIVPRSSIDFTNVGKPVAAEEAKPGDLILFTGTDSTEKFVGHMGLIVSNENKQLQFIHATSGKKHSVTISPLDGYYRTRYMKTVRIFN